MASASDFSRRGTGEAFFMWNPTTLLIVAAVAQERPTVFDHPGKDLLHRTPFERRSLRR
jgi:hypothetical protein